MLGTAAVRFRMLPERALEHFIQAEKLGLIKGRARTDALLRIGELARDIPGRTLREPGLQAKSHILLRDSGNQHHDPRTFQSRVADRGYRLRQRA